MIKNYLTQLESRVQAIEKLLGPVAEYSEKDIKEVRDGITDFSAKLPKEVNRKCTSAYIKSIASRKISRSFRLSSI
jgi:hypothetical protein